jgi:hypothetical protein
MSADAYERAASNDLEHLHLDGVLVCPDGSPA